MSIIAAIPKEKTYVDYLMDYDEEDYQVIGINLFANSRGKALLYIKNKSGYVEHKVFLFLEAVKLVQKLSGDKIFMTYPVSPVVRITKIMTWRKNKIIIKGRFAHASNYTKNNDNESCILSRYPL